MTKARKFLTAALSRDLCRGHRSRAPASLGAGCGGGDVWYWPWRYGHGGWAMVVWCRPRRWAAVLRRRVRGGYGGGWAATRRLGYDGGWATMATITEPPLRAALGAATIERSRRRNSVPYGYVTAITAQYSTPDIERGAPASNGVDPCKLCASARALLMN